MKASSNHHLWQHLGPSSHLLTRTRLPQPLHTVQQTTRGVLTRTVRVHHLSDLADRLPRLLAVRIPGTTSPTLFNGQLTELVQPAKVSALTGRSSDSVIPVHTLPPNLLHTLVLLVNPITTLPVQVQVAPTVDKLLSKFRVDPARRITRAGSCLLSTFPQRRTQRKTGILARQGSRGLRQSGGVIP